MRIFLMIDLHLSAFAPRWRFLYVVRIDAYILSVSVKANDAYTFKQGDRIMPGITIRKISRAANHYSADSLFYSSATPFSTSSQTILTTKFASCLHLEMIYSFVPSVIPFMVYKWCIIRFLIYTLLESIRFTS